jgi:hypothetical protein
MTAVARNRWAAQDVLAQRAGLTYPPLLLGTSAVTRVLADIAHLEPVSLLGLPEAAVHRHSSVHSLIRKLVRAGIVRKLSRSGRFDSGARTTLIMNRQHPACSELRGLARAIGNHHCADHADLEPDCSGMLQYPDVATVSLRSLFGTPRRTLSIVLAHLRPGIRIITISRCIGTNPGVPAKAVRTLVRDGILRGDRSPLWYRGRIPKRYHRLISVEQSYWTPALEALIDRLVSLDPHFQSKALTADALEADAASEMRRRPLMLP